MKLGINLYLWADEMHDGLMPVLESLKDIGYDGVEVPIFDLDQAAWTRWAQRLDELGLERTANTVIAPEHDPVSADPRVRQAAYDHMRAVIDCCAAVGARLLCGPHQVALGVFTGSGPTEEEWNRSVEHLQRVSEYAAERGVTLAEEVVNRFELYHLNILDQAIRFVDEVAHPNCRIHLDTFHAHIEEKDPGAAIRRAGNRIAHVHISENDRGVPGTGSVAWKPTFEALHDIRYDGWLTVEAFGNFLPNLAAATRIWRQLFETEEQLAREAYAFLRAQA
ncbi:MAG TPA: sugar phosphate isomerase/epimerase family protein [Solirubrobacteraceae bacterium]|nr:sugar phosphate isomerase/epimerase family protein [Solirubrobacteraceae bacterium]